MEIKTCKRCGEPWCFHGTGRPIRCGKCKSPYWDRERVNASRDEGSGRQVQGAGRGQGAPVERREEQGRVLSLVPAANDPVEGYDGGAETVEMCHYTEYDPEDGETYRCGLAKHGPKVKHTRGRKV